MNDKVAIRDWMSASLVTFTADMDVLDAMHALVEHRIAGAPVIDPEGNLIGMLTERDCLSATVDASYHGERAGSVRGYMSTKVETVEAGASLMDVAQLFLSRPYRRYPVMQDNQLVGIISRRDLLRGMLAMHRAY